MSEDARTLWVGNLHEDVTDELVYELFLQTGPIEKLIFPTEGEGAEKKHKGHAYVLFKHADSVQFSSQVLEGTKLFGNDLEMKARSMPITYRSTPAPMHNSGPNNRFNRFSDNNSLRGGFNRTNTWHGREDFAPRGRGGGGYRHKGPSNYSNNYNQGNYNNYNSQANSGGGGYWMNQQQSQSMQQQQVGGGDNTGSGYSTEMDAKRQRLLQQQNMTLQTTGMQNQQQSQQQQGGMMNMGYNMQQPQQQNWSTNNYSTGNNSYSTGTGYNTGNTQAYSTGMGGTWNTMGSGAGTNTSSMYQSYGDQQQYNTWYQQQ